MTCVYRPQLNHLWSVWYTAAMTALQSYLIYLGAQRYRLYADAQWAVHQYPAGHLTAYLALHAAAVVCIPLFIAFGVFKVGNLASDNDSLGHRTERVLEMHGGRCLARSVKAVWQHAPPLAQTVHVLVAFALLMAQQLMLAQLYDHGFIRSDDVWDTELDFAFQSNRRLTMTFPTDPVFLPQLHELSSMQVAPRLAPVLLNHKLFGVPLELANYVLALFVFTLVYPSVLWRANKPFSLLFSLHLFVGLVAALFGYVGFSLLYRVQLMGYRRIMGNGVDAPFLLRHHYYVLADYLAAVAAVYAAPVALYCYGHNKFCVSWVATRSRALTAERSSSVRSHAAANAAGLICCEGYGPHISAILLLIVMVMLKAPLLYDMMILYQHESSVLILTCIVVDVVYLFAWILLWLGLTLKRDWQFKASYTVPELVRLLRADRDLKCKRHPVTQHNDYQTTDDSMIIVCGTEIFVTSDASAKLSILRQAQKFDAGGYKNGVYWLKPAAAGSPLLNRFGAEKQSPEMARLISYQRSSDEDSRVQPQPVYQQVERSYYGRNTNADSDVYVYAALQDGLTGSYRHLNEPPGANNAAHFGTMPRVDPMRGNSMQTPRQHAAYAERAYLQQQRSEPGQPLDTYASIHKDQPEFVKPANQMNHSRNNYGRYGSSQLAMAADSESVASRASSYANLAGNGGGGRVLSARGPPHARILSSTPQSGHSTPRVGAVYAASSSTRDDGFLQRSSVPPDNRPPVDIYSRKATGRMSSFSDMNKPGAVGSRETTPSGPNGVYGGYGGGWPVAPPAAPPRNGSDAGSYTPSGGTLTSQGSYAVTPTAGSPQNGNYATLTRDGHTRFAAADQQAPDRNDSANFSLTSSAGSAEYKSHYSTSMV